MESSRKPLVLPCGHSFCEDCLSKCAALADTSVLRAVPVCLELSGHAFMKLRLSVLAA